MNYLELAKDYIAKLLEHEDGTVPAELATSATMFVTANALIAIAEQLEKMNGKQVKEYARDFLQGENLVGKRIYWNSEESGISNDYIQPGLVIGKEKGGCFVLEGSANYWVEPDWITGVEEDKRYT